MYADHLLRPWLDDLLDRLPAREVFDVHTHVGDHDPSGFTASVPELLESLSMIDGRAAVFPLAEPGGYREANLGCAKAAGESDGRLVAFARVTPYEEPDILLDEALAAGARGLKLHLSSDRFGLEDPRLAGIYERAAGESLPVLVHAGPEESDLTDAVLRVCADWPELRLILAHCAIPSLGRLWRRLDEAPGLFFDTSWWTPAHLVGLFRLVPPGRILNASDLPYSTPVSQTLSVIRCAWQAGLEPLQIGGVLGGNIDHLLSGEGLPDPGQLPNLETRQPGPFLEMASTSLTAALEAMQRGGDPGVPLTLARHACTVDDHPDAPVLAAVRRLLDIYEEHKEKLPRRNQFTPGWDLVSAAAVIARTPAAPVPEWC